MIYDPVCGMDVETKTAAGRVDYQGQTYYFCSAGCKKAFEKDPERYIKKTDENSQPFQKH
jgi:YHS domain-containing protein